MYKIFSIKLFFLKLLATNYIIFIIMRKGIVALIGMIITLVFIIIALIRPWYGGHGKEEISGQKVKADMSLSLAGGEGTYEISGQKRN